MCVCVMCMFWTFPNSQAPEIGRIRDPGDQIQSNGIAFAPLASCPYRHHTSVPRRAVRREFHHIVKFEPTPVPEIFPYFMA